MDPGASLGPTRTDLHEFEQPIRRRVAPRAGSMHFDRAARRRGAMCGTCGGARVQAQRSIQSGGVSGDFSGAALACAAGSRSPAGVLRGCGGGFAPGLPSLAEPSAPGGADAIRTRLRCRRREPHRAYFSRLQRRRCSRSTRLPSTELSRQTAPAPPHTRPALPAAMATPDLHAAPAARAGHAGHAGHAGFLTNGVRKRCAPPGATFEASRRLRSQSIHLPSNTESPRQAAQAPDTTRRWRRPLARAGRRPAASQSLRSREAPPRRRRACCAGHEAPRAAIRREAGPRSPSPPNEHENEAGLAHARARSRGWRPLAATAPSPHALPRGGTAARTSIGHPGAHGRLSAARPGHVRRTALTMALDGLASRPAPGAVQTPAVNAGAADVRGRCVARRAGCPGCSCQRRRRRRDRTRPPPPPA
jgi:hypothetical protein